MRVKIFFFFILFFISFLLSTDNAFAEENSLLPAITIINPIRGKELGHEKDNLLLSLKDQWKVIKNHNVKATWLWQYTALEDADMVKFAKESMRNQEFGLFLEIDKNHAQKSGVVFRGQGPWYFSDGLFLISYDKNERKKLIDADFKLFKEKFGYYPKTVGAWWVGADSLNYMHEKYGVIAAMKAADQGDLDVYSIWGSPWSIPYVASKENEAIPGDMDNNSGVVILQWAARDPLRGYKNALFSNQDYGVEGYTDYIASIYLKQPLGNLVVGLENGSTLQTFDSYYSRLDMAKDLEKESKLQIISVEEYAKKFLNQHKPFLSSYFLAKDFTSDDQSFWHHSENYRAGIHKQGDEIYLVDLRDYSTKLNEDFSVVPNSQGYLHITTAAIIDSLRFPNQKILLAKSKDPLQVVKNGENINLLAGNKKIASFSQDSLEIFPNNKSKIYKFEKRTLESSGLNFDKKQLLLFSLFPVFSFIPVSFSVLLFQIIPFLLGLLMFYLTFIKSIFKRQKLLFFSFLTLLTIFYIRIPYFPLDRSSYLIIGASVAALALLLFIVSFIIFKDTKSKKIFLVSILCIPVLIFILVGTIYLSRTSIILTQFEMEAISLIKEKHKDVIFISETDYNIKPIYKAAEPLLYENYHIAEKLTNTEWEIAVRPENNMIKLTNYNDKIVVAPRFLGADFSDAEMNAHNFKKIFDNAQIAIFEKR